MTGNDNVLYNEDKNNNNTFKFRTSAPVHTSAKSLCPSATISASCIGLTAKEKGQGKSSSSSQANALKCGIHCGKPVIATRGTTRSISIFLACLNVEAVELCFLVCCYLVI